VLQGISISAVGHLAVYVSGHQHLGFQLQPTICPSLAELFRIVFLRSKVLMCMGKEDMTGG